MLFIWQRLFAHFGEDMCAASADARVLRIGIHIRRAFPAAFALGERADSDRCFHRAFFIRSSIFRSRCGTFYDVRLGHEEEVCEFFSIALTMS